MLGITQLLFLFVPFKLMIIGGENAELSVHDDIPLKEYNHCLTKIICNPLPPDCYFQTYNSCPGITGLKEHLRICSDG